MFPTEYSLSGWFKWTGPNLGNTNLLFKLAINNKKDSENTSVLGFRILSVIANVNDGYYPTTQTYQTMTGNGREIRDDLMAHKDLK